MAGLRNYRYSLWRDALIVVAMIGLTACGTTAAQFNSTELLAQEKKATAIAHPETKRMHTLKLDSNKRDNRIDPGSVPPWMSKRTPVIGSPEWKREEEATEKREREIKKEIKGICTGC